MLAQLGLDAARRRLISGFIDTYLRLTDQEQAQFQAELAQLSPQEQEATMELTTTWKEEGRREGQQAEALSITRRLLTRRFGLLAPELDERISILTLPRLETLIEDLLDFTSMDDLRTWLDTNPSDEPGSDTNT
jgi:hypothetical protein